MIPMRALSAAIAALLLSACAHPLEIRNLDRYSSLARGEPLERQTVIGLVTSAPDAETRRLAGGVGKALGRYSARVLQPYDPKTAQAEVVARITATPRYEGSGSNWLVNFPGLLVAAPSWNGYAYEVGYDFQVLLTRAWDNAKLDAWSVPVSLDVRHSSGLLLSPDYNPEVTEPTVSQAGEVVADHIARDIVRRLNSEGRLWKLEPPPEWTALAPAAAPPPSIATTPLAPPVVAVPAPAPSAATPGPAAKSDVPPPPRELVAGATARLRSGGAVRMRPLPGAEALAVAAPTVKLNSRTRNASGDWWFVSAGGKSGWVLASDLQVAASAAAPGPGAPAPTPVPAAPAPAPGPAPAAVPATPAAWSAGQPARLRTGVQARVRMAPDAEPAKGVDPARPVTLKSRVKRDTGVWWYVVTPGGSGWVLEADLQPAAWGRVH